MKTNRELIEQLQNELQAIASTKSKDWWEKYMRQVIPFRGVGIPQIRERLAVWRESSGVVNWNPADQLELALEFFACPIAEDKLAGILLLQNYLYDQFPWPELIPRYAALFQSGQIFDWNICDWFCVRVLGPTISLHGMDCAAAIANWQTAENLWQARASVVAFVPVADQPQYHPLIFKACATLLHRDERFAKTAVGWILRDMAGQDKAAVVTFIEQHLSGFSPEALKNATKHFEKDEQQEWIGKLNSGQKKKVAR